MKKVLFVVGGKIEDVKNFAFYEGFDPVAPSIHGMKILNRQGGFPFGVNDSIFVKVKNNKINGFLSLLEEYNLKAIMTPNDNNVIHWERVNEEPD